METINFYDFNKKIYDENYDFINVYKKRMYKKGFKVIFVILFFQTMLYISNKKL